MSEAENWIRVAAIPDVARGTAIPVETMGLTLAVYHLDDGTICVTDNICTHAFALLTEGWFEDGIIECPLYAGQFDVRTGKGLGAPIDEDLRVYEVKLQGDDILIALPT